MRVVKIDQGSDPDPQIELAQIQLEHPTVLVIWRDAFFDFDQSDAEDIRPDYLVHTVGFLVAEGPKFVSLARKSCPTATGSGRSRTSRRRSSSGSNASTSAPDERWATGLGVHIVLTCPCSRQPSDAPRKEG